MIINFLIIIQDIMKKVGIITFHSTNNYGAALQCYALQKAMCNMNIDAEVINYTADMLKRPYCRTAFKEKGLIRYIFGNVYFFLRSFRNKNFNKFRKLIRQTPEISKSDLNKLNSKYDYFFTGSDQVWNGTITSYDDAYYLGFVKDNKKKNSYAASFGMNSIPQKFKKKYSMLLKGFNSYSVREESGITIIRDLLEHDAIQTIDPTLLLNASDWESILSKKKENNKYIFVYQISPSKIIPAIIKQLKKRTGYKVVAIPFVMGFPVVHKMNLSAGPLEWLYLIKNAEYIVTDSFHGTAFSTLFNKKFLSCVKKDESRISSFLKKIKMEDRIVSTTKLPELYDNVDFSEANIIIQNERKKSIEFIENIINEG